MILIIFFLKLVFGLVCLPFSVTEAEVIDLRPFFFFNVGI